MAPRKTRRTEADSTEESQPIAEPVSSRRRQSTRKPGTDENDAAEKSQLIAEPVSSRRSQSTRKSGRVEEGIAKEIQRDEKTVAKGKRKRKSRKTVIKEDEYNLGNKDGLISTTLDEEESGACEIENETKQSPVGEGVEQPPFHDKDGVGQKSEDDSLLQPGIAEDMNCEGGRPNRRERTQSKRRGGGMSKANEEKSQRRRGDGVGNDRKSDSVASIKISDVERSGVTEKEDHMVDEERIVRPIKRRGTKSLRSKVSCFVPSF